MSSNNILKKKGLAKIWVQKYLMIMLDNLKSNCLEKKKIFIIIITYYIYKIQKKIISTMSWSDMLSFDININNNKTKLSIFIFTIINDIIITQQNT